MKTDLGSCAIGAFVNGTENLESFQKTIQKKLAAVLIYVHWPEPFPISDVNAIRANGSVPLLTWEPWVTHELGTLEAVASGRYQDYVRDFIRSARDWGGPLLLRFTHEMNGNWYPWDGFHNGGESAAEKHKRAWVYIYNVRKELKAENVKLVWCPNNTDQPRVSWNSARAYYPGDQYVDWIGMDGYNWGFASWEAFDGVFGKIYQELTSLTKKPLMIGEFACAEQGGSKPQWISDALGRIKADYPCLKLFCWFNINKERDWRIESSPEAAAAFRSAIGDSYFSESLL